MTLISKRPISDYFLVFGKAASAFFLFLILLLADFLSLTLIGIFTLLFTIIYITFVFNLWNKRDYWSFDGKSLIRGKNPNLTIYISEVNSLRVGLPKLSGWGEKLRKFDSERNYQRRQEKAKEALLIYLDNDRVLPLGLKSFNNGELLSTYLLLSFIKKEKPELNVIDPLINTIKKAKNISDYEQKVEQLSLCIDEIEANMEGVIRNKKFKKKNDAYSNSELEKLSFSSLNKVIQL